MKAIQSFIKVFQDEEDSDSSKKDGGSSRRETEQSPRSPIENEAFCQPCSPDQRKKINLSMLQTAPRRGAAKESEDPLLDSGDVGPLSKTELKLNSAAHRSLSEFDRERHQLYEHIEVKNPFASSSSEDGSPNRDTRKEFEKESKPGGLFEHLSLSIFGREKEPPAQENDVTAIRDGDSSEFVELSQEEIKQLEEDTPPIPEPDYDSIEDIVKAEGFCFERHEVMTYDGFILILHRLYLPEMAPFLYQGGSKLGVQCSDDSSPWYFPYVDHTSEVPVVFVQHGMLSSSENFILNGRKSLAFVLAARGYDVWLGNNRGNLFSSRHTVLDLEANPKDKEKYFDFSFVELGKYDIPAMLQAVKDQTQVRKLVYIGHSQGTTQLFYCLAEEHPELAEMISLFVCLAPIVQIGNDTEVKVFGPFAKSLPTLMKITEAFGIYEFFGPNWDGVFKTLSPYINEKIRNQIKANEVPINEHVDEHFAKLANTRPQNSVSTKTMAHFTQIRGMRVFAHLDYGEAKNMEKYGQKEAPLIDITKVNPDLRIVLFVGEHDKVSTPASAGWIIDQLQPGRSSDIKLEVAEGLDHSSFAFGRKEPLGAFCNRLLSYLSPSSPIPYSIKSKLALRAASSGDVINRMAQAWDTNQINPLY